ncbi:MAG: PD-(D/E)XK nuclease family protein [Candidatus Aureabacteria bacterium]|nr:PD-(D/E)XK nuclease family protein [Candidatus Auribacterota bacterium]
MLDDGSLLVIDYKTGGTDLRPRSAAPSPGDCSRSTLKGLVRSFQLPLYLRCATERWPAAEARAALYSIRDCELAEYPRRKDGDSGHAHMAACISALGTLCDEITDPAVPFEADDDDPRRCARCEFRNMCR